jgi:hypothetical protein
MPRICHRHLPFNLMDFLSSFKSTAFLSKYKVVEDLLNIFRDYPAGIAILSGLSVGCFLLSLVALPWMVCRIPEDFFLTADFRSEQSRATGGRWIISGIKNLLGAGLFLVGGILLFMPGQGLLTMLMGVILMDFPGKKRVLGKLLTREDVRTSLNWIRKKMKVTPLRFPLR